MSDDAEDGLGPTRASTVAPRGVWSSAWRWLASVALLGVVGHRLWKSSDELARETLSFSWGWASVSFAALMLFLAACSLLWCFWVRAAGESMRPRDAFRVMFLSNLAKYLPGGVWGVVGQVALCRREGMAALPVSLSVLLEMACQVAGATLAALPTFSVLVAASGDPAASGWIAHPGLLLVAAAALVAAMHPRVMNAMLALGERVIKKPLPRIRVSYRFILGMLVLHAANWAFFALAFAALGQALLPEPMTSQQLLALVGAFLLAWNAGVFAFFLPAGLGAREVALVVLLGGLFPAAWPAKLALAARLWVLAGELLCFGVALLLGRQRERPS